MRYVLFVCTHNAGRSQMAQGFFEQHTPTICERSPQVRRPPKRSGRT
jgi:protein-tyrosine-phosphatase